MVGGTGPICHYRGGGEHSARKRGRYSAASVCRGHQRPSRDRSEEWSHRDLTAKENEMLRRLRTMAAITLGFLAVAFPAAGQVSNEFTLRGDCQTRLHEYQKKPHPGHFFYVEDSGSTKYSCGFSFEDPGEFDRYPSSAQTAFSVCQNGADVRGIKTQCAVMARGAAIMARSYAEAQSR